MGTGVPNPLAYFSRSTVHELRDAGWWSLELCGARRVQEGARAEEREEGGEGGESGAGRSGVSRSNFTVPASRRRCAPCAAVKPF